jgi:hypothetical protein
MRHPNRLTLGNVTVNSAKTVTSNADNDTHSAAIEPEATPCVHLRRAAVAGDAPGRCDARRAVHAHVGGQQGTVQRVLQEGLRELLHGGLP